MKRVFMTFAMVTMAWGSYAQILESNFLNGYKEGDKLEKQVYRDKKEPMAAKTWCGAFSSNITEEPNPIVGSELLYDGYAEKGLSITFGGYPEGTKGARFSVYSMTDGKKYARGTLYLSCLVNFSKVPGRNMTDFLGLSASYVGGGNRANIYAAREGSNSIRFGTSLLKVKAETTEAFEYDKTHLLVLKLDYSAQKVSLYVDPKLETEEPAEASCVAEGDADNVLRHAIRSVAFRNRTGFEGSVGNFRLSDSWAGVIAQ